jgi:hypothetical protein
MHAITAPLHAVSHRPRGGMRRGICFRNRVHRWAQATFLTMTAALAAFPVLGAPAIPNGSFEANAPFNTPPGTIATNAAIVGWAVTGDDVTQVGLNPVGGLNVFANNGVVPQGKRVMFLNSSGNNPAKASTIITGLVAGRHYRVDYRFNRMTGPEADAPLFTVQIDGDVRRTRTILESVDASPGVHETPYRSGNLIFRATGPTARLDITNQTSANSRLLLDRFTIVEATPLLVTNANNDGPGSLRAAIDQADREDVSGKFRVITFAPALSGQTIPLLRQLTILVDGGIAIDASSLPKGITLGAVTVTGVSPFRIFQAEESVHVVGVTFTGGRGDGAAARIFAEAQFTRCTMFGNIATGFGGAIRVGDGTVVLTQCTITQNSAQSGGAISIDGDECEVFMDHCTIATNGANTAGGGVFVGANGRLTIRDSIVSGNFVIPPADPATAGGDIMNNGTFARLGANVVDSHVTSASGNQSGDAAIDAPPILSALADNGGPTRTMALTPTSPGRNLSEGPPISTDQRGRPVQNEPDIGAFEVQVGNVAMQVAASVQENLGTKSVIVQRRDGFEGDITVNLSTIAGSAGPADFTPINNLTVNFPDGIQSRSQNITIAANDGVVEPNEVFTVALSAPTGGATLGAPPSTTVTIIDPAFDDVAADTVAPPAPVITSPAATATLLNVEALPGVITVSGTATDNLGVSSVPFSLIFDGGAFTISSNAGLDSPGAKSTAFSFARSFGQAFKTVTIQLRTRDGAGRFSPFTTRTLSLRHPLGVAIAGNGTVAPAGYTPRSFRETGSSHTLIATPGAGQLFAGWTVLGAQPFEIGLASGALLRPTLTFLHKPGLQLIATFVPSPFNNSLTGPYNALVFASGGTRSNSTEGFIHVNVTSTGAFSGSLQMDGSVLPFAGALDHEGVARFGTSRTFVLRLPRVGKPTFVLHFLMDESGGDLQPTLSGGVIAVDARNEELGESIFFARHPGFSAANPVPVQLMGSPTATSAVYNVIIRPLPVADQPPDFQERYYAQGAGFGRLTLTRTGTATFSGVALADGTTGITASTFLDSFGEAALYFPLYNKQGFFRCILDFDNNPPSAPMDAGLVEWLRPPLNSHYYAAGWREIIATTVEATRYTIVPGRSSLDAVGVDAPIEAPDLDGNATLQFSKGQLDGILIKRVNVTTADAVTKVPANDPTFALKIDRNTGLISGTFGHTDSNVIPFRGILFQKGALSGGWGYFLTKQPTPIDFSGESGLVQLIGVPVQ